jgi:hypothetical protein
MEYKQTDLEDVLKFIKMIEGAFEIQAKAIMVNGVVVLHEGKFQQRRLGVIIDADMFLQGVLRPNH